MNASPGNKMLLDVLTRILARRLQSGNAAPENRGFAPPWPGLRPLKRQAPYQRNAGQMTVNGAIGSRQR